MKNTRFTQILLLTGGILIFTLTSCASTVNSPTPEATSTPPTTTQESPEKTVFSTSQSPVEENKSPVNSSQISQEFQLTQYNNDDWQIAVVEVQERVDYYGCNLSTNTCQTVMNGEEKCGGDVCFFDWVADEDTTFTLEISEYSKKLIVTKAEEILFDSGELRYSEPSTDLISSDQEYVAGVTAEQLEVLIPQIQKAVFYQDWLTIADLSVAEVNVNYDEGDRSTKVANADLAETLAAANLDSWAARVMVSPFDDLFLNQYGAMLGSGAIWITTGVDEITPKIYSINIF